MGLTSNTGLLASVQQKTTLERPKVRICQNDLALCCEVTPAPYMLRPYAGLYHPFSHSCSVLCNHPSDTNAKEVVKRAKDAWVDGKAHNFQEDEKTRTLHDIFTEDMFRRYTETDSRPLTPTPTLASGKSRGSRRCLTPDQPLQKTALVVDLRRSHSQETLYYRGHSISDITGGQTNSATIDTTLPSLNLSEIAHDRLLKVQSEQLPPLASPIRLSKRSTKESVSMRPVKKTQLKALNIGKVLKNKKTEASGAASQRSKGDKEAEGVEQTENTEDSGEVRRRGKRRRKAAQGRGGSDRLTSAGLAAQSAQDPETQVAGIETDSRNQSSRGSVIAQAAEEIVLPVIRPVAARKTDSFLNDDILKYLHREVDEEAIETEFDTKRRYVLEEALRTRPVRAYGEEMQNLLRELRVPAVSLGDWLHVPRVFSRQNSQFTLPIDTNELEVLTPMQYAARHVTILKSKQLLYLTVLRKFRPEGYRIPITDVPSGLVLMMGGILKEEHVKEFQGIMEWEGYEEEPCNPDDIKLRLLDTEYRRHKVTDRGDTGEVEINILKYRTWCGLCAICERMYGRYPSRDKDPPDGMELSDFTMIETKLAALNVHPGLSRILHTIRTR